MVELDGSQGEGGGQIRYPGREPAPAQEQRRRTNRQPAGEIARLGHRTAQGTEIDRRERRAAHRKPANRLTEFTAARRPEPSPGKSPPLTPSLTDQRCVEYLESAKHEYSLRVSFDMPIPC